MGYESALHLLVNVKPRRLRYIKDIIKRPSKHQGAKWLRAFLQSVVVAPDGSLEFRASKDGLDPYVPFSDTDTVIARYGKWYDAEKIARWLKKYADKKGRIVLHSTEGDGEAWGWEFDGRGRMRALGLVPVTKWS